MIRSQRMYCSYRPGQQMALPVPGCRNHDFGTPQKFDFSTGNLLSRSDGINGQTEIFGYDNLNRFVAIGCRQIGYDNKGNILPIGKCNGKRAKLPG